MFEIPQQRFNVRLDKVFGKEQDAGVPKTAILGQILTGINGSHTHKQWLNEKVSHLQGLIGFKAESMHIKGKVMSKSGVDGAYLT